MKLFVVLSVLVGVCFSADDAAWSNFKNKHGKKYSNAKEEVARKAVFMKNKDMIDAHNDNYAKGLTSYTLAMNHLGDLSAEEAMVYRGFVPEASATNQKLTLTATNTLKLTAAPSAVDWRTVGAVTPVKNQGSCGSCYSFSANGAVEGAWYIKYKQLVNLSEQNIVDCTYGTTYGNSGCNGGNMNNAFQYMKSGVDTTASYPYTGKLGTCKFSTANIGAKVTGYVRVQSGNETALMNAVAIGPVSVAIDAGRSSFQFYSSGVYDEPTCSSTTLNHGVLAVGYGTSSTGQAYWIVKNSWGTSWGQQGYILMSRNKSNQCGIATAASYPTV